MGVFRLALRRLHRRPGSSAMVVVTLSLGVGVTTAIFSVVESVLLRPLPWPDPDRLVVVHAVHPERRKHPAYATTWDRAPVSMGSWDDLRASAAFDDVAAWQTHPPVRLVGREAERLLSVHRATSNLLAVLGVRPVIGRSFTPREDEQSNDSVLISDGLWRDVFAGQADVLSTRIQVAVATASDQVVSYEVVGVLPPGVVLGGVGPDLISSTGTGAATRRTYGTPVFRLIGRLAPGTTRASAELEAGLRLGRREVAEVTKARVATLHDEVRGAGSRPLWLLLSGATMLLLVAGGNAAGLLLAEAYRRRPEMVLRVALGSPTGHLVRQLATEYALLAGGAISVGLLLAYWFARAVAAIAPPQLVGVEAAGLGVFVTVFAVTMTCATILAFGFVPVMVLLRAPILGPTAAGRRSTPSAVGARVLVITQTAVTLALVMGAMLLAETLFAAVSTPLGFRSKQVVVVSVTSAGMSRPPVSLESLRGATATPDANAPSVTSLLLAPARARTQTVIEQLARLPGVVNVAAASVRPFSASPPFVRVQVDGTDALMRGPEVPAQSHGVTATYFEAMDIPLLEGRLFTRDDLNDPEVALVSREFARRYLGADAVDGRFYNVVGPEGQSVRFPIRVIGVVGDVKQRSPIEEFGPVYYQPFAGDLGNLQHFILRTSGDASVLASEVRQRFKEVDPGLMVTQVDELENLVAQSMAEERFRAIVSSLFAAMALVLAAVGLYGLAVRCATDRRRELAIRVALGASATSVRVVMLRDVLPTVGLGLAVGVIVALLAASGLRAVLFGIPVVSPQIVLGSAGLLASMCVGGVLFAVRRVTVDDAGRTLAENL